MKVREKIYLDFGRKTVPVIVFAKQNDNETREIEIVPLYKSQNYVIEDGVTPRLHLTKPDGHCVFDDAATEGGNIIVELSEQILAAEGMCVADIGLYKGEQLLSSQLFYIDTEKSALDMKKIESSDEYGALKELIAAVKNLCFDDSDGKISLSDYVKKSLTVADLELTDDITVDELRKALLVHPLITASVEPTKKTVGSKGQLYLCTTYDGSKYTHKMYYCSFVDNGTYNWVCFYDSSKSTELADDVNERFKRLSSGVSEYTIEPSTLTVGYRMGGQNGVVAQLNSKYAVTDYIAIPLDTKRVEFYNNIFELHMQNAYCSTYDKDKKFVRNIQAVQIFNTLENERYVRFTCYDGDSTFEDSRAVKFYADNYHNDISKSKEICSNMSSILGGSLKLYPTLTMKVRMATSQYGWLQDLATNVDGSKNCISELIEIPLGVSKIIHSFNGVPNNTTYGAYAVYDKDFNFIIGGSEDTIEVADDYAYIRLCNYDTTSTHENLYCEFVFGNTKEVIDSVVEQTAMLSEAVNTSMYKTEEQYLYRIPYEMENYGFWSVTSNALRYNNNSGWRYTKFPVSVGDILSYCVIPYGAYYLVVVDENDKPLDYLNNSVNADVEGSYTVTNEKARYMYISSRVNCTNFYIKKDNAQVSKLPSDYEIQAINKKIASLAALLKNNGMELNLLPDDYMIELARVADETKAVKGDNTITFAVMADTHYDGSQAEMLRLADVLKELQSDGVIDFTVGVGDMLENQNTPYTDFTQILTDRGITYALIRGNHDLFKPSILRANNTNIEGTVFDTLGDWYYLDNEDKGVRYIFLNSCDKGTDVDEDKNTITMTFRGVSYRQLNWLANTALKTDKKVVIFNHCPVTSSATSGVLGGTVDSNYHSMGAIIQAFVDGTSGTITYTIECAENGASDTISYDFTELGSGTVIANFCGHSHGDRYTQNDGEIMEVWTDNALAFDNCGSNLCYNGAVIPDTVDEIAFDVVTIDTETNAIYCKRFGRGKDRTVESSDT